MLPGTRVGLNRSLACKIFIFGLFGLLVVPIGNLTAETPKNPSPAEPEVRSIYPLGAPPGASIGAEVLGHDLDGCYDVWVSAEGLAAEVQGITTIESEGPKDYAAESKPDRPRQRVAIRLEVEAEARPGEHSIRLVTPRGVSNGLRFLVTPYPSINQEDPPELLPLPVAVNGRIRRDGEEDFYGFEASDGQRVDFEVVYDPGPPRIPGQPAPKTIDPELTLYASSGSWFDPRRPVRLAFNDEPLSPRVSKAAKLTYKFAAPGRYLIKVGSFKGLGSSDYCYQLRVAPPASRDLPEALTRRQTGEEPVWKERDFVRVLRQTRLQQLWARTIHEQEADSRNLSVDPSGEPAGNGRAGRHSSSSASMANRIPDPVWESSSNDSLSQAMEVTVPIVVEGAIEHPGDVDSFKFQVQTGERLAFEIETPESRTPRFNPRLGVFDGDGREFLTNVYKRISRNGQFYLKTVEPKTLLPSGWAASTSCKFAM